MEIKILNKLEEMAENADGILPICVDEGCDKIKITLSSGDYWIGREDLVPQFFGLHDKVIRLYNLKEEEHPGEGVSGSYCPEGFQNYLDSIKK